MVLEVIIASVSIIGSMLVHYAQKQAERKAKDREIKEKMYVRFLEALIQFKTLNADGAEAGKSLQSVYLVGSADVVTSTRKLINYLETHDRPTKQTQDEFYTAMVYAMKRDLYKTKPPLGLPVEIGLTTFT